MSDCEPYLSFISLRHDLRQRIVALGIVYEGAMIAADAGTILHRLRITSRDGQVRTIALSGRACRDLVEMLERAGHRPQGWVQPYVA